MYLENIMVLVFVKRVHTHIICRIHKTMNNINRQRRFIQTIKQQSREEKKTTQPFRQTHAASLDAATLFQRTYMCEHIRHTHMSSVYYQPSFRRRSNRERSKRKKTKQKKNLAFVCTVSFSRTHTRQRCIGFRCHHHVIPFRCICAHCGSYVNFTYHNITTIRSKLYYYMDVIEWMCRTFTVHTACACACRWISWYTPNVILFEQS